VSAPFTRGAPSPAVVQAHVDAHPHDQGSLWLVIDPHGDPPRPGFLSLRLGALDDLPHMFEKDAAILGQVLLRNGLTSWQSLLATQWAARSLFLPVSPRGLPLPDVVR